MNREILFRGKHIPTNEWVEGSLVVDKKGFHYIVRPDEIFGYNEPILFVDKDTVCQYTGLKDKNGNKIFENDIVTLFGEKYVVKWKNNSCTYIIENSNIGTKIIEFSSDYYEIIGNIIDNKELLNQADR